MKKSALILSLVATLAVLTACGGGGGSDSSTAATSETPTAAPVADGSCKIVDGIISSHNCWL